MWWFVGIMLSGKILSQCHFVYCKSHMDWHGSEPGLLRQLIARSMARFLILSQFWIQSNLWRCLTSFAVCSTSLGPSIKRKNDGNDGLWRDNLIRKMHLILSYTTKTFSMTKRNCCHHGLLMKLLARHSGFRLQKPHIWHIINSPPVTEIKY